MKSKKPIDKRVLELSALYGVSDSAIKAIQIILDDAVKQARISAFKYAATVYKVSRFAANIRDHK